MSRTTLVIGDRESIFDGPQLRRLVIPKLLAMQDRGVRLLAGPSLTGDQALDVLLAQGITVEGFYPGEGFAPATSIAVTTTPAARFWAETLGLTIAEADWSKVGQQILFLTAKRKALIQRQTRETRITGRVNLDSSDYPEISTGIGFFDHMLEQLAAHAGISLRLTVQGDLHIDEHHTVEDTALALGEALREALATKRGIGRYGFVLPMDESHCEVALDLGGRPYCEFRGVFPRDTVGNLATELIPHFFKSLTDQLKATLHISVRGENAHHMIESVFKAVGRCLRQACAPDGSNVLPSTKGIL